MGWLRIIPQMDDLNPVGMFDDDLMPLGPETVAGITWSIGFPLTLD